MRYIIDRVIKEPDMCGALINLEHWKAFDNVYHRYLDIVLRAAGFHSVFCGWILTYTAAPAR